MERDDVIWNHFVSLYGGFLSLTWHFLSLWGHLCSCGVVFFVFVAISVSVDSLVSLCSRLVSNSGHFLSLCRHLVCSCLAQLVDIFVSFLTVVALYLCWCIVVSLLLLFGVVMYLFSVVCVFYLSHTTFRWEIILRITSYRGSAPVTQWGLQAIRPWFWELVLL